MAALPENYVSLQQLRERWLVRQREGQGREGDDRKRLTGRRKQEKVSGKARVREEYGAGDIADRRKSYYWSQNKDGGGADGGGGKGPAAAVSEGFARERGCAGGSESMIGSYPPALGDGRKLPRGKEIEESSCFARAVVEDTFGEVVKRGECRPRNSDRGRIGFERSSSGPVRSKVEEAQGNGLRPSGRNKAGDRRGCGGSSGSRRERAAPVAEDEALERPNTKWSESEVSLGAQKSKIAPEDDGGVVGSVCFISAVAEESGGRKAEGEVFHVKKGKSKKKSGGKKRKVAGKAVSKDVEPADMSSRTEGKLGYRQKNGMSSKETVFCNDEGEVTRKLRFFSIDSTGRRSDLNKRSSPAAKNSRSWGRGNPKGQSGVLAFRMERDMVWVKKGDALGGYNMDDVTRAN